MKYLVVLLVVVVVAAGYVEARPKEESKILRYDNDVREDGYSFGFETSDPIKRNEEGKIVEGPPQAEGRSLGAGEEKESNKILRINGDYGFNFPDGVPFSVVFTADENGYRPKVSFGTQAGSARP